jgi:hypothetical protein
MNLELWDPGAVRGTFVYGTDLIGVAKDSKGDIYRILGPPDILMSGS